MFSDKIKKYFTAGIIVIMAIIILSQRACEFHPTGPPQIATRIDTIWKYKHDTIIKTVTLVKTIHVKQPNIASLQPSKNLDTCNARFNKLVTNYIDKHIYSDTIKFPDITGNIVIVDTVQFNKLHKRSYFNNYKIPTVIKEVTITKESEEVNQLYIGGNLFGYTQGFTNISTGAILKTKKDHIYQAMVGVNFDGNFQIGVGTYWKIRLKKK